jgi:ubiquitin conjugation factor E4 A
VFSNLLRHGGDIKERVTIWFINCLQANKDRGKMVSIMQGPSMTTASDGFFINLSWVLLMLCAPFSTTKEDEFNSRLMSIDPFYCNVTGDKPHVDFSQETKLVFKDNTLIQSSTIQPTFPVKFMTHCFFLTHNCLSLGPMQTINNYKKISQIIARVIHLHI